MPINVTKYTNMIKHKCVQYPYASRFVMLETSKSLFNIHLVEVNLSTWIERTQQQDKKSK